ncbi:TNF receptor-associated factor 2-like [Porites lutea]|uniref:TNF receptor-associated factor 2-like n=1 Tax=Porites lutea TaxID=51062 RepID=UPI003CC56950
MPGYAISAENKGSIDKRYFCLQCNNIFRDPVQTDCGHVYCKSCIRDLKRDDGMFICLVDKSPFAADQVFPDNFMKREALSLVVECPNYNNGCVWKGEVRNVEKHLLSCPYKEERCTNKGCSEWVRRVDFQQHIERECPYRPQTCPSCGESITAAFLKSHQEQDCKMQPVQCRLCRKQGILRGEMEKHVSPVDGDCEEVERSCSFEQIGCEKATKKMKYSEAKKHNQICSVFHLNLLLNFVLRLEKHVKHIVGASGAWVGSGADDWMRGSERLVSEAISKIDTAVKETTDLRQKLAEQGQRLALLEGRVGTAKDIPMVSNSAMLLPQNLPGDISRRLTNAENGSGNIEFLMDETVQEINNVKQEISSLRGQVDESVNSVRRLERRIESIEHNLALRNVTVQDIEEHVRQEQFSTYDGILLWKVTEVARRTEEARSGRQSSIYSPCFYTSRHGYKMCARLYLNGDGMGKGTHLSLFFVLMRGEFDALLRWPFRQKVTMMLMDQDNVEHVIDAFRPDPRSTSFQRPRRQSNIASGCPNFCSLSDLNSHAYVRDDTMFIKIIVDTTDI